MKLTNKQKTIIRKSLKLNEDFFDDNQPDIYDETGLDLENEYNQQYTYHFQFIFHLWPFIKYNGNSNDGYYFENPKYKLIIESGFLSMKKALNCILLSSHIVTEYSEPKFCTLSDKFISIFPFMNNKPEDKLFIDKGEEEMGTGVYKEIFNKSISLEMTLNLSNKKNQDNAKKLLYSFYKLKLMYDNLIKKFKPELIGIPPVEFGYFRNNPFVKMGLFGLFSSTSVTRQYPSYITNILLADYEELKKMHDDPERKFQPLLKS